MGLPGSAWTRVLGRQKLETTPLLSLSLSSGPSPLGDGRGCRQWASSIERIPEVQMVLRTKFAAQRSEDAVARRRIREAQHCGNKNCQCLPWLSWMPLSGLGYICLSLHTSRSFGPRVGPVECILHSRLCISSQRGPRCRIETGEQYVLHRSPPCNPSFE